MYICIYVIIVCVASLLSSVRSPPPQNNKYPRACSCSVKAMPESTGALRGLIRCAWRKAPSGAGANSKQR